MNSAVDHPYLFASSFSVSFGGQEWYVLLLSASVALRLYCESDIGFHLFFSHPRFFGHHRHTQPKSNFRTLFSDYIIEVQPLPEMKVVKIRCLLKEWDRINFGM